MADEREERRADLIKAGRLSGLTKEAAEQAAKRIVGWTKEPPSQEGYYWRRDDLGRTAIVEVQQYYDPSPNDVKFKAYFCGNPQPYSAASMNGEWLGPLSVPK